MGYLYESESVAIHCTLRRERGRGGKGNEVESEGAGGIVRRRMRRGTG